MPLGIRVVDQIVDQADFQLLAALAAGDVLRFSGSKWRNYSATGATLPTSPITGQLFLHTPTGRSNLMIYDGSSWRPILSIGTWTLYVDTTNGTDDQNRGWGTGTNAFKTVQFAVNQIGGLYSGNILTNVAAGTYSETVSIRGKMPTGAFTITIRGTLTVVESITATGGTQGSGASHGTVTKSSSWGSYADKWLQGKSGSNNNVYRIIDSVSGTTANIVGYWSAAPTSGDSFDVVEPGTIINQINVGDGQQNIVVENIEFAYPDGSSTFTTIVGALASVLWRRCKVAVSTGTNLQTGGLSTFVAEEVVSNKIRWFFTNQSAMHVRTCKFTGANSSSGRVMQIGLGATCNIVSRPSVFDGTGLSTSGIVLYVAGGGNVTGNSLYCLVRVPSGATGVRSESTGTVTESANFQYSGSGTYTSADAASYGVIA